jgi:hypothetical protein
MYINMCLCVCVCVCVCVCNGTCMYMGHSLFLKPVKSSNCCHPVGGCTPEREGVFIGT